MSEQTNIELIQQTVDEAIRRGQEMMEERLSESEEETRRQKCSDFAPNAGSERGSLQIVNDRARNKEA